MAESTCDEARETIEQWLVTYSLDHFSKFISLRDEFRWDLDAGHDRGSMTRIELSVIFSL